MTQSQQREARSLMHVIDTHEFTTKAFKAKELGYRY